MCGVGVCAERVVEGVGRGEVVAPDPRRVDGGGGDEDACLLLAGGVPGQGGREALAGAGCEAAVGGAGECGVEACVAALDEGGRAEEVARGAHVVGRVVAREAVGVGRGVVGLGRVAVVAGVVGGAVVGNAVVVEALEVGGGVGLDGEGRAGGGGPCVDEGALVEAAGRVVVGEA